jgi:hypothetical protein
MVTSPRHVRFTPNNGRFVRIGDTWRVQMTVTEKRTASGQYRNEYKIVEVLEFIPGLEQMTLMKFFDESEDDEADKAEPQEE